ncbi:MAG TPA: SH3 domain-containing protein [Sedimentisphaerales bacterium]|nr:SH3 domain-containing protein [Sedimentisphaerales bacterium]HRV47525.1 SH3 domain-containing protein [Sedimentisphaerales bacterium]
MAAPTVLPHVTAEMNTPGFWIGRLAEPDKVILSGDEIRELNSDIRTRLRLTKDITEFPQEFDGPELRTILRRELDGFRNMTLYDADGRQVDTSFYASIEDNMRLESIGSAVQVRFGFVVCNADQRLLPTAEGLYAEAGDIDFDQVQNSALDIGTPVAILHTSADRQWHYTMGPSSDGWIETGKLALCSQEQLRDIMGRPFVTVVRAKGNVYLDAKLTQYHGFVRMGSRLFLSDDNAQGVVGVVLPARADDGALEVRTGYLKRQEVVAGTLSCTPRHIIEQAFEMLNTPYGWGGANGQQDCSQFVQEVFATVGVQLPRNSSDQACVGRLLGGFRPDDSDDKKQQAVVTQAIPGASLLHMKGHVMLYIGEVAGRPYVIHDVWAYRQASGDADAIRVINRVAVTDLHLGEGSRIGSLLHRLDLIRSLALNQKN